MSAVLNVIYYDYNIPPYNYMTHPKSIWFFKAQIFLQNPNLPQGGYAVVGSVEH